MACREAEFLQLLDHPNIVECKEVVENEKQMVIIMEWLRGGHLLDNLEEMAGQHYSEQQASVLFVQVRVLRQPPVIVVLCCSVTILVPKALRSY